ncbi:phage minor head protein [Bacillus sp. AFS073361]|uniref:phage minor head protein n=1 Tax=Bacillus sp. AFS073361 TaxID=2033511 RepID=UPI0015D4A238|nr:phage minor head protein [Bacillus sp. AFS073361]
MAFWDRFMKKTNEEIRAVVATTVQKQLRALPREKQTKTKWESQWNWYEGVIHRRDYKNSHVMENLRVIRDLNPDASMAIWNMLRLANTGHEVEALTPNGKPEKKSTDLLNSYADRVGKLYGGGLDQLINVLLLTAFTQGAIALEVELAEDLSDIVDFHAVDPSTLDFRRNKETNEIELVQKQEDGNYKVLNQETVFYYPIDPDISDPHGRSPILPILQIIFFQVQVLKDLQKVIHHQGYDRFDIKVVEEAIIENLPDHIKRGSPEDIRQYVTSYIGDIQRQMEELQPDDDFYHTSSVEISAVGVNKNVSLSASGVIDIINQQIVTALKQLPILLGRNEGTTETHGTVQWQIYVAGIQSIQRGIKRLLERAYNVALQINGRQRTARITFNELRTTDRQSDAQAEKIETETKILQMQQGWIDNNEAANDIVGHDAVAEPQQAQAQTQDPLAAFRPATNSRVMFPKKRADDPEDDVDPDEFIVSTGDPWAEDLGKMAVRSASAFEKFLKRQCEVYLDRLKDADEMPTRMLYNCMRATGDNPTPEFREWVETNILHDSEEQKGLWDDLNRDWLLQAAILSGEATLQEFEATIDFDARDERLLRWLADRARREAELIQGVTDEEVIMNLWDIVYEGQLTMDKAAKRLEEVYAFSESRALTIARTEIISAGRSGQYFGDMQSGMVIGKKWMAAQQDRTRDGHRQADGQVVKFDEPFLVANGSGESEQLLFPGDTSLGATASNVIMCRCWYKRILDGEEMK